MSTLKNTEHGASDRAEALMLVTRGGKIECATPLACRWLAEHFASKPGANRLPLALRQWLATPQGKRGQCRPFTRDNDQEQLVVTLLHSEADRSFALLVKKRSPGMSRARLRHFGLTAREAEVFEYMCDGKTNGQIAQILGVGQSTVKRHVEHILEKLHVDNRTAAVATVREFR